ncbi:unnamed protein product, partial [marine sediment metagenome]
MSERVTVGKQVDRTAQQTRAPETDFDPLPVTIIEPSHGWISLRLRELIEYRDLLFFLAWRDVSVRYKQTILGAAWAVIQPFF